MDHRGASTVTTHYTYDGVRRIMEQVTPSGGPTTTRYYVYGPGYVDEVIAQVETRSDYPGVATTHYYLQDGNYNVTAMVDPNGDVVRQYAYTPYGEPMVNVVYGVSPPTNDIGHQGLIYFRLDGVPGSDPLSPGGTAIVYNRNRWYSPALGRFLARDVSGSAAAICGAVRYNGMRQRIGVEPMAWRLHFADGLNIYTFTRSSPVNYGDPLGLFSYGGVMTAVGTGSRLYGAYSTGMSLRGKIEAFANGMSLRSIALELALEIAIDQAGGKILDAVVDVVGPALRRGSNRIAASLSPSRADDVARNALPDEPGISVKRGSRKQQLGYHTHHGFPQEFRDDFEAIGIDVDDPIWHFDIDGGNHLSVVHGAGQYNKLWRQFLDGKSKYGEPSADKAIQYLTDLAQNGFLE